MSITPEGDFTYYPFPDYEQHIAAEPFVYMTITPNWLTPGSTFEVVWEAYGAESCSAGGEWAGTQATRGKFQNSFSEEGTYTYTLTCSNGNGSTYVEREVTVDWGPPQSPQNPQNPEGGETTDENERTTYGLAGSVVALRVQTQTTGNHLYYMHGNHLGSMTVITDENGDVVDEARYYPFGKYRVAPTEDLTDIGYTGHRHNDDIGLIYMGARYYDPALRRFVSADTIVPNATQTIAFNRFAYAYQNPIKYIDPAGYCGGDPNNDNPFDENGDIYLDCTPENFDSMSIEMKIAWLQAFNQLVNAQGWFNNIGSLGIQGVHPDMGLK